MANFVGNILTAVVPIVLVPVYVDAMGIAAYALVGLFTTLLAVFGIFDLGLATTLSRELARSTVDDSDGDVVRNLVRTLELIYWGMALLIGIIVLAGASPIASYWLESSTLDASTVHTALLIMGAMAVLQWPFAFYCGGLQGLQHQVLLNGLTATMVFVRGVGAVLVLWLVSPTIEAFFLWQLATSGLQTLLARTFLWSRLPRGSGRTRFDTQTLRRIWKFAAGMSGIAVVQALITQIDRVVASKMLTLEMLGYYTLGGVVAAALYRFIQPVFVAFFPRFSQLVAARDEDSLVRLYHEGCQLVALLVVPVAMVIAFFPGELLRVWTDRADAVVHAAPVLRFLILGTMLNGILTIPSALQFAYGWTRLIALTNAVAILVLVPAIVGLTHYFGPAGAASSWFFLNVFYTVFLIVVMHRRLLKGQMMRWYVHDVGLPSLVAAATAGLARWLLPIATQRWWLLAELAGIGLVVLAATTAAAPAARRWALGEWRRRSAPVPAPGG
ncbi:MAG: oligosaccharide flippase family protein [Deltaproteobacteria bacterium]|nr:oligosaccharide flippase family protein [Deltaproteobacteria bacterium]